MKKDRTPFSLKIARWIFPKMEYLYPSLSTRYFIKIFFSPIRYAAPAAEKESEMEADQTVMDIEEKKIQVYRWGRGEKIILVVHGWAGRATQFKTFIPALVSAGYTVVGFDGPAHGKSSGKSTNLIEFNIVLRDVAKRMGNPAAIIAHSFGGVASLYAISQGLDVNKLINISTPTIGDEIINAYLRILHGSAITARRFNDYMIKRFHVPFDDFSAVQIVKKIKPGLQLLLVHDEQDKEVILANPIALLKVFPAAEFYKTTGLGHNRILKDEAVITKCVNFITNQH